MTRQARTLLSVCLLAAMLTLGLLAHFHWASAAQQPALSPAVRKGSPLRRLTYDGRSTPLAWTADGRTLLVKRPGQTLPGQQLSELWAVAADGGDEHLVSKNAYYPVTHGNQVAYLRYIDRGQWEAMAGRLDATSPTLLGAARWNLPPAWIADDVIYLDRTGQLVTSNRSGALQFPNLPIFQERRARASHTGRRVAFTDGHTLWVASKAGQRLVAHADQIWGFSWSPAAAQLAYVRSDDGPTPELWIWDASTERARLLAHDRLAHFDAPVWSPDGLKLAFAHHATGNSLNAAGDIWLVNADGTGLRPLALTSADERAPCWSPDGQSLAFALEGDVWLADLNAPGLSAALVEAAPSIAAPLMPAEDVTTGLQTTPLGAGAPLTIRIKHDGSGNTCRDASDGQIDVYNFEGYVKRVVPQEVPPSWPTETLKTQAVAARTYAWRQTIAHRYPHTDPGYDVWDSTRDQYMCDHNPDPRTDAAVDTTEGQHISYSGNVIYAFFCAEASSPTNYRQELDLELAPYLRPVEDPVSFGQTRRGHSWGMSQWGAYRWAAWHGWDYYQILAHYYSFTEIEPSSTFTKPIVGLSLPWPDFYINRDYAYLRANAAGSNTVLTITFAARITDTWTTVYTDADGSDGWSYVWPLANTTDTFTPSIALRATAYDDAGYATESEISLVGLHRTPPTGTLDISDTAVNTLAVTLDLSAADPTPVSGTIRVSLGNDDWVWEDTDLHHAVGISVPDSAAGDGSAWHVNAGTGGLRMLRGPYTEILPTGAQYRALFRIKAPTETLTNPHQVARLDVSTDGGDTLLGIRYIHGPDFQRGNAYQEFAVDFDYPASGGEIEFRTDVDDTFELWIDRVRIVSYPVDVSSQTSWVLPAREGPVTVTAKYVDRAGNLSGDVTLAITVTDEGAPGEWQQFRCSGVTCTVQVRDVIAGLDVSSAQYQISTDGGASWSGWQAATCSGVNGSHDRETIAAPSVLLGAPPDPTQIQFRIRDMAATANTGTSPIYTIWQVLLPLVLHNLPMQ